MTEIEKMIAYISNVKEVNGLELILNGLFQIAIPVCIGGLIMLLIVRRK